MKGGDYGKAKVTLDGAAPVLVDIYTPSLSQRCVDNQPSFREHHLRMVDGGPECCLIGFRSHRCPGRHRDLGRLIPG